MKNKIKQAKLRIIMWGINTIGAGLVVQTGYFSEYITVDILYKILFIGSALILIHSAFTLDKLRDQMRRINDVKTIA